MKGVNSILFVADGAPDERYALERAMIYAASWGSRLVVMDVIEIPALEATVLKSVYPQTNILERLHQSRSEELEAMVSSCRVAGCDVRVTVSSGRLHTEVVKRVTRGGHKLLIKAARGPAHNPRGMGPMDLRLIRLSPCSVMVLRETAEHSGVLLAAAALDGPRGVQEALEQRQLWFGRLLASQEGAALHLAHAWDIPDARVLRAVSSDTQNSELRDYIEETHSRLLTQLVASAQGVEITPHLLEGWASHVIPRLVEELKVEMLLLGSRESGADNCPSLGSILHVILHQVNCPVLICKA